MSRIANGAPAPVVRAALGLTVVAVALAGCTSAGTSPSANRTSRSATAPDEAVRTGSGTAIPTPVALTDEHGAIAAAQSLTCTRTSNRWSASATIVNSGAAALKYSVQFNVVNAKSTVVGRAQQVVTVAPRSQRAIRFANFYTASGKSTGTKCVPHITSGTA